MNTLALCIPAYNAENFLPRLLQSAKNQIIPFDEILVYNDCSTDNTAHVAAQYGVTVLNGNINKGCSYGKNQLAAHSTCKWLHFHDADDELMPNFTTLAHKWMNNLNCPDVVLFNYEYRDNNDNQLLGIRSFNKADLEKDAISYAIKEQINPFCGLYKKSAFFKAGGYDTDPLVLYNEDKAFHLRLAINGLTFSAENEISIINYRVSASMSSSNRLKCIRAQYYVLKKTAATHGKIYSKELADQLYGCTPILAAEGDWLYVKKALALCVQLGNRYTVNGGSLFKFLTRLNPYAAVWFREKMIRLFKPHQRKHA
ncbi:MAG: hypothetical protein JWR05_2545 [Mucilaginibacter sp.]|nr:hypothetical protein [Mucilaginibacter sp.]